MFKGGPGLAPRFGELWGAVLNPIHPGTCITWHRVSQVFNVSEFELVNTEITSLRPSCRFRIPDQLKLFLFFVHR